jgi:hypothetical protein
MNKLTRNFLLTLTLSLCAGLLLCGCDLTAGKPSAPAATNAGAGNPAGAAQVSVSDGVILLTPGQPFPTQAFDVHQFPGFTPAAETETPNPNVTPTAAPMVDISSIKFPKGLSIYPGATNLDTSGLTPSTAGLSYIIFYTKDSSDKVFAYYVQALGQAGWTTTVATAPGPSGNAMGTWYSGKQNAILVIKVDPQAGTMVTLSWMGT